MRESLTTELSTSACRTVLISGLENVDTAIQSGALSDWEKLADRDPFANVFQCQGWAVPWYRAYRDDFVPLVIAVTRGDELAGVVPLAEENGSKRLVFAGDNMADYADIVALPDCREEVIRALLRVCRQRGFAGVFRLGSTMPESNTVELAASICRSEGIFGIPRTHMGCRWWRELPAEDPFKSRTLRYSLNRLQRRGPTDAEVVRNRAEWEALRDEFYQQHSLRQLYGGRKITFDNQAKRNFFDAMFDSPLAQVSALRAAGRPIACQFDFTRQGVLYWGPPAFDVREQQHSPGLLLISLIMRHAGEWGIRGFDLTMGEGYLKERCGNSRVDLPMLELYSRRSALLRRRFLDVQVAAVRRVLGGRSQEAWRKKVRPRMIQIAGTLRAALSMPPRLALRYTRDRLLSELARREKRIAFQYNSGTAPADDPADRIGKNQIYDLLKGPEDGYGGYRLSVAAQELPSTSGGKRDLHTLVREGRILAWGFSTITQEPADSGIDGFAIPPSSGLLQDFDALPGEENALERLLARVAAERRSEGAQQIWLLALNPDGRTRGAIQKAGFQAKSAAITTRVLKWTRKRVTRA